MLSMNSSYYIIRLIKSGYTNLGNWDMYNFICIGGVVFIATLIFVIKGGDIFVDASIKIATKSKIPTIIVGAILLTGGVYFVLRQYNLIQKI